MEREILIRGRLTKVNCEKRTAELNNFGDTLIELQFEENLSETMQQLATCFVKVVGVEQAGPSNQFGPLKVREISVEWPSIDEIEAVEPRIFDPVRATGFAQRDYDDQADMDEFIRIIHGERDS
ncbi:MAG: hypothetical protein OXI54_07450 [Chloroflexota bacterium]|nr:hypothetical protein [Chloroflexota bacterium]MDE2683967.1 hypothetical protein [Chloroflexota bacterium]